MTLPGHPALEAYTGFLLRKVSSASFNAFSEIVAAHGLHPMHFGLLAMIDAEAPISQQDLSRRTGIDPSTMVARMDVLDEHGLVDRTRSAVDRRTYEIRLSDPGRRLLTELNREAEEHGERFFGPLSKRERTQLHELLLKLVANLERT